MPLPNVVPIQAARFVAVARAELGYQEGRDRSGNWNNHQKYSPAVPSLEWSQGQPWCATGVSWCALQAGVADMFPRTASCDAGGQWFKARSQWHESPEVGDQVFFGTPVDLNHTGIVCAYDDVYVWSIEFNTNNDGSRNGDGVYINKRERRAANVVGYGRPNWAPNPPAPAPAKPRVWPIKQALKVAEAAALKAGRTKLADRLAGIRKGVVR